MYFVLLLFGTRVTVSICEYDTRKAIGEVICPRQKSKKRHTVVSVTTARINNFTSWEFLPAAVFLDRLYLSLTTNPCRLIIRIVPRRAILDKRKNTFSAGLFFSLPKWKARRCDTMPSLSRRTTSLIKKKKKKTCPLEQLRSASDTKATRDLRVTGNLTILFHYRD